MILGSVAILALFLFLIFSAVRRNAREEDAGASSEDKILQEEKEGLSILTPSITRAPDPYLDQLRRDQENTGKKKEDPSDTCPRIKKGKDGRLYTPYTSELRWEQMTEEERAQQIEDTVPVLQDANRTIDSICTIRTDPDMETYAYILSIYLGSYCRREGIAAHEGEFLAYGEWISKKEETFYIELDDPGHTILLATAVDQGIDWKFTVVTKSRAKILKEAKENEVSE